LEIGYHKKNHQTCWEIIKMSVVIPDDIVYSTRMTECELLQEIAVLLYQKEKLSMGQASKLANLSQWQFQSLLSSRKIQVHYDIAEFESDLKTLHEMGRI
jgi:predicted HTH domain antitoxin